jgi:hypothetical protein
MKGDLGGEPGEAELTARPRRRRQRCPSKQRGEAEAWTLARTRGQRRGVGWIRVLYEGKAEEGTKQAW